MRLSLTFQTKPTQIYSTTGVASVLLEELLWVYTESRFLLYTLSYLGLMLTNYQRDKLINSVLYFATNTKFCGLTKLFKLLYFLDFEHYKQTGRGVTGLDYYAWKMGPVPVALYDEIDSPEQDLAKKVSFKLKPIGRNRRFVQVEPKSAFDASHFSKRELRLMETLATEYRDAYADDLVEATHIETLPWHQVFNVEGRKQKEIPYDYALRKDEKEIMGFIKKENDEIVENYK